MERLPSDPTITDVMKAYKFLRSRVRHTPAEYSPALSDKAGAPVFLKLDNQQICGSFKVRGAFYKMFSLPADELARGIVTCSSGNHAQGVAKAAAELRAKARIYVPDVCPETKKRAIRRYGGEWVELVVSSGDYDFAEAEARAFAAERGMTFISPFEDPDVIAGQGTAGVEFLTDEPETELLLVPAGGGALLNGTAIAAAALAPKAEVWGVQSEASNPWVVSWEGGVIRSDFTLAPKTIADGLSGAIPQSMLTLAKRHAAGIIEVTEDEIEAAIAFMHREHHQQVEGAGAVGVAALLAGKAPVHGRRTGVIISGGNIDEDKLLPILEKYKNTPF
ncbi:threonine/serine dehydratase [Cloacibacillus sp. An23]|uniref:threonine ammonia-lyase n=1 Tax=Cloacibacillus sp. An23 TaxID=1965591 RepID=UPI000B36F6EF|nr:threonine/serine dehydratase [Cloacibacillus sp. An23]OUO95103.1 serine/threonine dehydratase [Cloacibacillus sp. An23]